MNRQYFVYILSSRRNGTLYIGVTIQLIESVNPEWKDWSENLINMP